MVEKLGRNIVLIVAMIVASVLLLILFPIRRGLDLQGGTRLVYRVDFDLAEKRGDVRPGEDRRAVLTNMVGIMSQRLDPTGILEAVVQTQGSDRILIEMPETEQLVVKAMTERVSQLGALEMRMLIASDYNKGGVKFDPAKEKDRLSKWLEKKENKERILADPANIFAFNQNAGGEGEDHPLSEHVTWYPVYALKDKQKRKVTEGDPPVEVEREVWVNQTEIPDAEASLTAPFQGDPRDRMTAPQFIAINKHETAFSGKDLVSSAIRQTADEFGQPAVSYQITDARAPEYAQLSGDNVGKKKAIILNQMVRTAPVFQSRIYGQGQITLGRSDPKDVENLIMTLKTGSLRIKPELVTSQTLGASLGTEAVKRGVTSLVVGSVLVILFMLVYYRLAGVVAVTALLLNLLLLLGCMAGIHAVMTLPGIAGLVLTMGMAVDVNILIYERVREELDRGKGLRQAVKAGFDRAFTAIFDGHLTAFLCGVILYNVGTGPIRGFAVTLMIGLATSMVTGVFISKVIMHLLVNHAGITHLGMMRLWSKIDIPWMKYRRPMLVLSLLVTLGSVAAFFVCPPGIKYGLDFMGGAAIRTAFREPVTQKEVLARFTGDPTFTKEFATPLITTAAETDPQGRASEFSIKLKLTEEQRKKFAEESQLESQPEEGPKGVLAHVLHEMQRILGDKLSHEAIDKVRVLPKPGTLGTIVVFDINFIEPVKTADLLGRLRMMTNPDVKALDGDPAAAEGKRFRVEGDMGPEVKASDVPLRVQENLAGLKTVAGTSVKLSNPFPEAEEIGPRAVGDLTNAAARAVLIALFMIMIYLRVRFHEYKYGIGAVASLLHDVLVALGFVVVFHWLGLVDVEIDLALIAVFLTVIGYSVNDTIVIFDRVREDLLINKNLGNTKETFEKLLDRALNQTFSRTIFTSGTVVITVLAMFLLNVGTGSPLEGFSFPMLIGLFSGTYSTIFIAAPIVLWIHQREERRALTATAKPALPKASSRADATV